MKLDDFEARFPSKVKAADALGVTTQTFRNWRRDHNGVIPDPWDIKAMVILDALKAQSHD